MEKMIKLTFEERKVMGEKGRSLVEDIILKS